MHADHLFFPCIANLLHAARINTIQFQNLLREELLQNAFSLASRASAFELDNQLLDIIDVTSNCVNCIQFRISPSPRSCTTPSRRRCSTSLLPLPLFVSVRVHLRLLRLGLLCLVTTTTTPHSRVSVRCIIENHLGITAHARNTQALVVSSLTSPMQQSLEAHRYIRITRYGFLEFGEGTVLIHGHALHHYAMRIFDIDQLVHFCFIDVVPAAAEAARHHTRFKRLVTECIIPCSGTPSFLSPLSLFSPEALSLSLFLSVADSLAHSAARRRSNLILNGARNQMRDEQQRAELSGTECQEGGDACVVQKERNTMLQIISMRLVTRVCDNSIEKRVEGVRSPRVFLLRENGLRW